MIELSVQKVMNHHIRTIRSDASVVEAASDLYDHDIGSLVITKSADLSVGIVTKSDINMVVAEGKTPSEVSVEEIMSRPITSLTTTDLALAQARELDDA